MWPICGAICHSICVHLDVSRLALLRVVFETGFTVLIFQFVVQRHFLESAVITLCDITNGSFQHTFVKSYSRPKVFKT